MPVSTVFVPLTRLCPKNQNLGLRARRPGPVRMR